jgi:hypothetical protein
MTRLCWAILLRVHVRQALDRVDEQPELWALIRKLNNAADEAYRRLTPAEARIYFEWAKE